MQKDLNLIRKIAWSYVHTTGLEFEELFSVAALGYTKALNSFNPNKSCFSTWAWTNMSHELNDFLSKEPKDDLINKESINPEQEYSFKESIQSLSQEAQQVCKMVFESPAEYISHAPKLSRGKIKDELRSEGWSWSQIWRSFKEIKSTLNEMA